MMPGQGPYAASLPANHPISDGQASRSQEMGTMDGQSLLRRIDCPEAAITHPEQEELAKVGKARCLYSISPHDFLL